jgi:hypothetical protein
MVKTIHIGLERDWAFLQRGHKEDKWRIDSLELKETQLVFRLLGA